MENNSLPIRTQRKVWTLSRLENVVCAILHSWPDLAVVKVEDSSRSQVLTGAVKESTILPASLAMTQYVRVPLEVRCVSKAQQYLNSCCLFKGTSVHHDSCSLGSDQQWWELTSLVLKTSKVISQFFPH